MSIKGQSFFNTVTEGSHAEFGVGAVANIFTGAYTLAGLVRTSSTNMGILSGCSDTVNGSYQGSIFISNNSGGQLYGANDFSSGYPGPPGSNADGVWRWYVITKPAGSAHYRFHTADLATLTWTHGEAPTGAANQPNRSAIALLSTYAVYPNGYDSGAHAVLAGWMSALSDAEVEAAFTHLASDLEAANPDWGVYLPQAESATPGSIKDFTGGGGNETARNRLSVDVDPADFTFDTYQFPVHFLMDGDAIASGATKFSDAASAGINTSTQMVFDVDGTITHVRFPTFGTATAAVVQGGVYSTGGTLLASTAIVADPGQDDDGGPWIDLPLTTPLNVTAGTAYRVTLWSRRDGSMNSPYWGHAGFFDGGNVTHGHITAQQGWFADGFGDLTFPGDSFGNNFYSIDVVFVPDAGTGESTGTAAVAVNVSVAATGHAAHAATAGVGVEVAVSATGVAVHKGSASAGVSVSVAATGERASHGSAAVAVQVGTAATGHRSSRGSAALGVAIRVAGFGQDPSTIPLARRTAGLSVDYGVGLEADYEVGLTWDQG